MNNLNIIYTRFSLFNKNILTAWRLCRTDDIEVAKAALLEHERLETRCDIFFNYTLPNIDKAAKLGHNIKHIVMHYSELPLWVLEKFREAEKQYCWLKPIAVGYEDDVPLASEIKSVTKEASQLSSVDELPVACIRLDDDDILGTKFFKQLELYLKPEYQGFCISFPKGVTGLWDKEYIKFSSFYSAKIALGLSQISLYDVKNKNFISKNLVPPGNHIKVDERVPTILDSRNGPYFLRTFHSSNDELFGRSENVKNSRLQNIFKDDININPLVDL